MQYKQILNAFQSDYLRTSSQLHVKLKSVSINQFSSNEKCISFTFAASSSFEKAHAKTDISPTPLGELFCLWNHFTVTLFMSLSKCYRPQKQPEVSCVYLLKNEIQYLKVCMYHTVSAWQKIRFWQDKCRAYVSSSKVCFIYSRPLQ